MDLLDTEPIVDDDDTIAAALSQLSVSALTATVVQITGGGQTEEAAAPVDLLASAPVEARAVFGVMQAPVELAPVSLEEMLQTQSFFAVSIEKNYFASYASNKGTFRTFLRTCLEGFLNNQDQAAKRFAALAKVEERHAAHYQARLDQIDA